MRRNELLGGFVYIGNYEPEERRFLYQRDWNRKHSLYINGRWTKVNKRPRPLNDNCEVCKQKSLRLDYHHWDNSKPENGIWLCKKCHNMAEGIEHGRDKIYLELRERYIVVQVEI